jgi:hypothetical protein
MANVNADFIEDPFVATQLCCRPDKISTAGDVSEDCAASDGNLRKLSGISENLGKTKVVDDTVCIQWSLLKEVPVRFTSTEIAVANENKCVPHNGLANRTSASLPALIGGLSLLISVWE